MGLSTAYYAAKRGHQVTVLERRGAQHEGCSYGNAGYIVPSHIIPLAAPGMVKLGLKWMWNPESPFYIKPRLDLQLLDWCIKFWRAARPEHVTRSAPLLRDLNFASRECFEDFARAHGNEFGLVKRGLLNLCKTEQTLEKEIKLAKLSKDLGMAAEVLDAKQTAALDRGVRMDVIGSVYFPEDAHICPNRFMEMLKAEVKSIGVRVLWERPVRGWRASEGRIHAALTEEGDIRADEFVLCGGAWSTEMGRKLGLRIPMQAGKGYSLTLRSPRQMPALPAIFTEARVAVTPMGQALRFGGTMEIAGTDESINPARVRGILKSVPKYYPDFRAEDFDEVPRWCGLRPCSPDGLPYVGRTRRYDNLAIGTGHAMMGLSLGPITGKLIAEILSDEKPSLDIRLLDPDRYGSFLPRQ